MEFWRYVAQSNLAMSRQRVVGIPLGKPARHEVSSLTDRGLSFLSKPVHLLVKNKASRHRGKAVQCYTMPSGLPFHGIQFDEGLYVAEPALCLFSLSSLLPFSKAIAAGFELCGRYARAVGDFEGLAKRAPLMSIAEFAHDVRCMQGVRGVAAARRVARFVCDGSRSPMESTITTLLCLPMRLGGYSLPFPLMNATINVTARDRPFVKKSWYECDLYWPEAKFALEYDSNLHHTGATRIAEDASRRADLAYLGIEVATLTWQQTCDVREMDRIALLLAKRLGKRLRRERLDTLGVQYDLRSQLLNPGQL